MPVMVSSYRFLRGNRNRPLLPHRILAPLRELLLCFAELHRAVSTTFDDHRWSAAADALESAAEALRRESR
jgi:hypothetical protein